MKVVIVTLVFSFISSQEKLKSIYRPSAIWSCHSGQFGSFIPVHQLQEVNLHTSAESHSWGPEEDSCEAKLCADSQLMNSLWMERCCQLQLSSGNHIRGGNGRECHF